ncbi:MAG: NFACT RNA binding domain-containing protein, partial [Bacteroidota bacterium]
KIERREELDEHWQLLRRLRDQLAPIQTLEQLREFLSAHGGELEQAGFKGTGAGGKKQKEEVPFRIFTVDGGFQVWAGKSSENNDLLTTKYAKPNDYWFHARGSSGSHVILRAGTGKGEPGKKALEQAASVAAYYSKMKKAKNIPVAMTLKKYVRKPKGAPVGTVTIEREKVLFVDPELPAAKG